jgi:hypothetical protein
VAAQGDHVFIAGQFDWLEAPAPGAVNLRTAGAAAVVRRSVIIRRP